MQFPGGHDLKVLTGALGCLRVAKLLVERAQIVVGTLRAIFQEFLFDGVDCL